MTTADQKSAELAAIAQAQALATQLSPSSQVSALSQTLATAASQAAGIPTAPSTVTPRAGVALGQWVTNLGARTPAAQTADFDLMIGAKMGIVRIDDPWANGWTGVNDAVIASALGAGLQVVAILEDRSGGGVLGTWSSAFAAACTARAQHYGTSNVIFEIGNEVNRGDLHWVGGSVNVATYAACYKAARANILAVIPTALVIPAGLAPYSSPGGPTTGAGVNPVDFIQAMYAAGSGPLGGVAIHPYNWGASTDGQPGAGTPNEAAAYNPWQQIPAIRALMVANGDSASLIHCTEYGVPTGTDDGVTTAETQAFQATAIAQALAIWAAESYFGMFLVFSWADDADGDFGLFTAAGVEKAAFRTWLAGVANLPPALPVVVPPPPPPPPPPSDVFLNHLGAYNGDANGNGLGTAPQIGLLNGKTPPFYSDYPDGYQGAALGSFTNAAGIAADATAHGLRLIAHFPMHGGVDPLHRELCRHDRRQAGRSRHPVR